MRRSADGRLRRLEKWAARGLFALGGVLVSLILLAIIVKVMIQDGAVFQGSILLMIVVSAVLALFLAYLRDERKNSASTSSNQQQRLPQTEETAKTLSEPGVEMAASVTEHTTAKLGEGVITQVEKPQSG